MSYTREQYYTYLRFKPSDVCFREFYLPNFKDDKVFYNGQKWQIENGKFPIWFFGRWNWYHESDNFLLQISAMLPQTLCSNLSLRYDSIMKAEEDLAQALEKLKKPLIIQLTPTGFEIK